MKNPLKAQELDCRIQVNSSQIQGSNKTVFEEMQKALYEFMNNRLWTKNVFGTEERIECSFLLNLSTQVSSDEFKGTLQVTASRPVYNSGYKSTLLNYVDKNIQFRYAEGEVLDFNESTHHELTSLFAYYAYIIIGLDYDSFSMMGGSPYFEKAEKIVNNAQSSTSVGWKAFESKKNRYWLTENLLNTVYSPIREYSYTYHRLGMDIMSQKPNDGRGVIANGLSGLLKVHRQKPASFLMQLFFDAKSDEIVNILSQSNTSEAIRAYNILKEVDPTNDAKYQKITKQTGG